MTFPPANELLAFQKIANRLSFKKAADELSLTPSTVSHLLRSLEERLKTQLLNRTTRSVSLTESGLKLYTELEPILESLKRVLAGAAVTKAQPSGTVRISVNECAAALLLDRLAAQFYEKFPSIVLELIVDNHLVDIVAEGFDAGVRLRNAIPKDMIAIPITDEFRFLTVASPKYLKTHGHPKSPADLRQHNCIGFRFESGRLYDWEFLQRGKKISVSVTGTLATNNPNLMVSAAKNGIGIAYVAEELVADALDSEELVVVLKKWQREWPRLYLYYPSHRHMSPALRACIDALRI